VKQGQYSCKVFVNNGPVSMCSIQLRKKWKIEKKIKKMDKEGGKENKETKRKHPTLQKTRPKTQTDISLKNIYYYNI